MQERWTPGHEVQAAEVAALTPEQAREWRTRHPSVSPWRVVGWQMIVGALLAVAAGSLFGRASVGWSVGYGALSVVVPAAVFARGLSGWVWLRSPQQAVVRWLLWELVKMVLTIAMLAAAPRLVLELSWPAMLAGLVVTMKVYWAALWFRPRRLTIGLTQNWPG